MAYSRIALLVSRSFSEPERACLRTQAALRAEREKNAKLTERANFTAGQLAVAEVLP